MMAILSTITVTCEDDVAEKIAAAEADEEVIFPRTVEIDGSSIASKYLSERKNLQAHGLIHKMTSADETPDAEGAKSIMLRVSREAIQPIGELVSDAIAVKLCDSGEFPKGFRLEHLD
jgi:hypothetical protein